MSQVFAGLYTEGKTDERFLQSIVQRTIEEIAFDCRGQIDIEVFVIDVPKGLTFVEQVVQASLIGYENFGIQLLCVHTDADSESVKNAYSNKITPALEAIEENQIAELCKIIVAIVPVQEIEAWLLADKELLKQEIGTQKNNSDLGISKLPESITKPKETIENAIRIARSDLTQKRRNHLTISDLYLPIGQSVDIQKLEMLPSFVDFKNNVKKAFQLINIIIIYFILIV